MGNKNDRWSALSMSDRADLIKLYVNNGITNIRDIRSHYNSFASGGLIETDEYGYPADITPAIVEANYPRETEVWKRADASNADMVQRLRQGSSRATIKDWEDPRRVSTHKMMSAGNYVVGNVQNINGKLFDFTDPKHGFKNPDRAAIDSAIERGDYIEFDNEGDARYFAEHYKKHYNSFGDGGTTNNTQYYDNTYIEPAVSKAFNSKEEYNRYKGEQFGKNITTSRDKLANKVGTLVYDVAQLHPIIGTGLDIAYIAMNRGNEEILPSIMSTDGKITSLVDKIGKSGKVGMGTVFGKILQFPDTAFDVLKLIEDFKKPLNQYGDGGPKEEGGWSEESLEQRTRRYKRYDPTGGLGPITQGLYVLAGGNKAKGEENEYWKAYLGLDNAVPKMNPNAKTSWDDKIEAEKIANGELPSDFYGTTPRMDENLQAIADTLNTGEIYRNYSKYKEAHPNLPSKKTIKRMYETGKRILENPNTWQQVDGDDVGVKNKLELSTNEQNPLGMLAHFGMMWNPKEGALYMHDTYDFPKFGEMFVGDRPKEMKIRSKIGFDPKKGSKLLRDNLSGFYNYPEPTTTNKYALGGDKENTWDITKNASPTQYWEDYLKSADKRGISPEHPIDENEIARRQAWAESVGNDKAVSHKGARGRYQIMPGTLLEYQRKTRDIGDLDNPKYNRRVRDWEFNRYNDSYQVNRGEPTDSVKMGRKLAIYNYGFGNVRKAINSAEEKGLDINTSFEWLSEFPKETRDYVNFILRNKDTGAHRTNNSYKNRKK